MKRPLNMYLAKSGTQFFLVVALDKNEFSASALKAALLRLMLVHVSLFKYLEFFHPAALASLYDLLVIFVKEKQTLPV